MTSKGGSIAAREEAKTMLRHKLWVYAFDAIALMIGILIGVPFMLILLAPFAGSI